MDATHDCPNCGDIHQITDDDAWCDECGDWHAPPVTVYEHD